MRLFIALGAAALLGVIATTGCGDNDCNITLTCPSGSSGNTEGGGGGTAGSGAGANGGSGGSVTDNINPRVLAITPPTGRRACASRSPSSSPSASR